MLVMDLNADLAESGELDEELIQHASSINIACGGHAGDHENMLRCTQMAKEHGVAIGAHPGYEDPANFGRKPMTLGQDDIRTLIRRQLESILEIEPKLHHVKPHGALYNQADADPTIASAVISVIRELQPKALIYCPPNGQMAKAAMDAELGICAEGFIDRRYARDGSLCPRSEHQALIEDLDEVISQAFKITLERAVTTIDGGTIPLQARTLCVHGDSPDALEIIKLTRKFLEESGVEIVAA